MQKPIIEVVKISKQYELGEKTYLTLRDIVVESMRGLFKRRARETIWALKDISLNVNEGEVLGIVGRNGSGKSTLLKILARITHPTSGQITLRGRVASMLEVGTGFNPELTGRENVYLNGAILGMTKKEIDQKFDNIVDFAGIKRFIDTPVKHYSSGMYTRLAFAVAAHLDADILLVDEVLAVGDTDFQKKCLRAMKDISGSGRTVIYVSHDLRTIAELCTRVLYLDQGKVKILGATQKALGAYKSDIAQAVKTKALTRTDRSGNGIAKIASVDIRNQKGKKSISVFDNIVMTLILSGAIREHQQYRMIVGIYDHNENQVARIETGPRPAASYKEGLVFELQHVSFAPGTHMINMALYIDETMADYIGSVASFDILPARSDAIQVHDAVTAVSVTIHDKE